MNQILPPSQSSACNTLASNEIKGSNEVNIREEKEVQNLFQMMANKYYQLSFLGNEKINILVNIKDKNTIYYYQFDSNTGIC